DGLPGDSFGASVDLKGDAAVIGATDNESGGAAYVFTESGSNWSQTAELTPSDGVSDDQFGDSVALSGKTAVVGARLHSTDDNGEQGAAYMFANNGGTWTQTAELSASDGASPG